MSIDEAMYLIEHHKPNDVNNAYELGEAFCVAIDTMRKYQKIEQIIEVWHQDIYAKDFECITEVAEVVEDGNDD